MVKQLVKGGMCGNFPLPSLLLCWVSWNFCLCFWGLNFSVGRHLKSFDVLPSGRFCGVEFVIQICELVVSNFMRIVNRMKLVGNSKWNCDIGNSMKLVELVKETLLEYWTYSSCYLLVIYSQKRRKDTCCLHEFIADFIAHTDFIAELNLK